MIENESFAADDVGRELVEAPAADPAPKVVIVYRNRGLASALVPPALILLSALLILSHQRRTPIRVFPQSSIVASVPEPGPAPEPTRPPEAAARLAVDLAPPPLPDLGVAAGAPPEAGPVHQEAPGTPPPVAVSEPPPELASPPAEPPPVTPRPRDRTAIASGLEPDPEPAPAPPPVSREQVLDEIRREADRKEAELRRLEALKPRARALELAEMHRKLEAKRLPFHNALREALRTRDGKPADAIESLCISYGRTMPDEDRDRVNRKLKTSHARLSRKAKVENMRLWGAPEPMILDFLAHDIDRLLGTRGGPKSQDEVLVKAARVLLTMPPRPQQTRGSYAGAATQRPAPAPRQRAQ